MSGNRIFGGVHIRTHRIDARDVTIGMQIAALDRPWLDSPFLLQGFVVSTEAEVALIKSLCVYVDILVAGDAILPARYRPGRGVEGAERLVRSRQHKITAETEFELQQARPIYQHGLDAARTLYESAASGGAIDVRGIQDFVASCVASILRNPTPMHLLSRLRRHDEYTSEHSLNVALHAISFGRQLGLTESVLRRLGAAAMLHDVGKMRVPLAVLNKPGRLDADEAVVMRSHARLGYDILRDTDAVPSLALSVAHSHHETPDGTGYPRKLGEKDICDFTSIVSICDVFDAIISDRPYKKGRSSLDALKVIHDLRGRQFHRELAAEFIQHIGLYPTGSIVELRSGEVGVVTSNNPDSSHLPNVMLLRDADKQPMEPRLSDLRKAARSISQARLIRRILPAGAYGISTEECIAYGAGIG